MLKLTLIFCFFPVLLFGQQKIDCCLYIHKSTIEIDREGNLPESGRGSIIEVKDSLIYFIKDSTSISARILKNKIMLGDSLLVTIEVNNPDSLILRYQNQLRIYKPLLKFEGVNHAEIINQLKHNAWHFINSEVDFTLIPIENISGNEWECMMINNNYNYVQKFRIKNISYGETCTLFGFGFTTGYTTVQLIKYSGSLLLAEVFQFGSSYKGDLEKLINLPSERLERLRNNLINHEWKAIRIIDESDHEGLIQLANKAFVKRKNIEKNFLKIQFNKDNTYSYIYRKKIISKGNWQLTSDGSYILLDDHSSHSIKYMVLVNTESEIIQLAKNEDIQFKGGKIFNEKILFIQK